MVLTPAIGFLTDVGDSGVLVPLSLVMAATLWFFHSRRLALLLLRSVALACVAIVALKVVFLSCGTRWQSGLVSPSGHACLSAVVYGTLGTVIAAGRPLVARIGIGAVAAAFIGAIAVSRVALGIHTGAEVLVGLAVGGLGALWFAWSCARLPPLRVDLKVLGVAMVATVLVAYGARLPAESLIRHLARRMSDLCSLVRAEPVEGAARARAPQPGSARAG